MNKGIKIFLGVVVALGIASGVFLLLAKKKTASAPVPKTIQASAQVKPLTSATTQNNNVAPKQTKISSETSIERKNLIRSQWTKCKDKTIVASTNLFWNVQIFEGIPAGGTYAKGNLDGDVAYPVRVIIKADSQIAEKIKAMLVVGKTAFLRGTCTDVATDGSVVLQAF